MTRPIHPPGSVVFERKIRAAVKIPRGVPGSDPPSELNVGRAKEFYDLVHTMATGVGSLVMEYPDIDEAIISPEVRNHWVEAVWVQEVALSPNVVRQGGLPWTLSTSVSETSTGPGDVSQATVSDISDNATRLLREAIDRLDAQDLDGAWIIVQEALKELAR